MTDYEKYGNPLFGLTVEQAFVELGVPATRLFSFTRAADLFWQGFYCALRERGLTDVEAKAQMQSEGPRCMFDKQDQAGKVLDIGHAMGSCYPLMCLEQIEDENEELLGLA